MTSCIKEKFPHLRSKFQTVKLQSIFRFETEPELRGKEENEANLGVMRQEKTTIESSFSHGDVNEERRLL